MCIAERGAEEQKFERGEGGMGWILTQGVFTVVMKNWEPLVLGPALAMERSPGFVCLSLKFSSNHSLASDPSQRRDYSPLKRSP